MAEEEEGKGQTMAEEDVEVESQEFNNYSESYEHFWKMTSISPSKDDGRLTKYFLNQCYCHQRVSNPHRA